MAENGTMWKSDYPKKHFYVLGAVGLFLSIGIIVLESLMLNNRDDIRLSDIRFNPLLPASITGISFGIYFVLLSIVVVCAAKSKSRCLTITFLIMCIIGVVLDVALLSFHGLQLISRCNPNDVNASIIRNCRNEFDYVLLIMRHGSSLLMVIVASVIHGIVNLSSVFLSFYVLCHLEQKYLINGNH